jgi:hypothetical protein
MSAKVKRFATEPWTLADARVEQRHGLLQPRSGSSHGRQDHARI